MRVTPHLSRNREGTSADSFFRRSPLVATNARNRSPIAALISTAATVESTPPEMAPITLSPLQ